MTTFCLNLLYNERIWIRSDTHTHTHLSAFRFGSLFVLKRVFCCVLRACVA